MWIDHHHLLTLDCPLFLIHEETARKSVLDFLIFIFVCTCWFLPWFLPAVGMASSIVLLTHT